ncbi:MAG: hypothetical protein JSU07_01990 [Bacteroidetes bacterium]|nr:hypothetical protein [Bacteroidota bacterium]
MKFFKFSVPLALLLIFIYSFTFNGDKDALHKRTFNVTFNEVKDGQPGKKSIPSTIEFKNGKLFCDFFYDKFQFKWIKYRINKDSIYNDSTNTEVRYLEVEASATDDGNNTLTLNFNTVEWDLDGELKITKNDKLKKQFNVVGREKGGKPKKEKKKKGDENNTEATAEEKK